MSASGDSIRGGRGFEFRRFRRLSMTLASGDMRF